MSVTDMEKPKVKIFGNEFDVITIQDYKMKKDDSGKMEKTLIFDKNEEPKMVRVLDPEIFPDYLGKPISAGEPRANIKQKISSELGDAWKKPKQAEFGDVVEAIDLLKRGGWTKHGVQMPKLSSTDIADKIEADKNTINKYFHIAKIVNTATDSDDFVQERIYEDEQLKEFKKNPAIDTWIKKMKAQRVGKRELTIQQEAPRKVWEILTRLKMTPERFLQTQSRDDPLTKYKNSVVWLMPVLQELEAEKKERIEAAGDKYHGSAMIPYRRGIRNFAETGFPITPHRQPEGSPYNYDVKDFTGKYKKLRADAPQLEKILNFLKGNTEGKEFIKKQDYPEYRLHDAFFIMKINLELGARANEFLSISTNVASSDEPTDRTGTSGVDKMQDDPIQYKVTIKTRKSDWTGMYTHSGLMMDQETNDLIKKRLDQVKDGIGIAKNFHIGRKNFKKNTEHTLIGFDNEYVRIESIQSDKVRSSVKQEENQKELKEIFRAAYKYAELEKDYFKDHPFHTMRHIFAQYWLIKTNFDYDFIADLGHWKTLSVLKGSYAHPPDEIFFAKQKYYHDQDYVPISDFVQLSDKEKAKFKATYGKGLEILDEQWEKKGE